jgi:RP/EB family microtubule-associated protein
LHYLFKRYWDQFYPGGSYDAVARRKASDPLTGSRSSLEQKKAPKSAKPKSSSIINSASKSSKTELESEYQKIIDELTKQVSDLNGSLEQVTKEREFYFNKLREIEIFVQTSMDEADDNADSNLKAVQDILYKTEDGFEIPETDDLAPAAAAQMAAAH